MSDLYRHLRQSMTGLLTAAMILTGVPLNVNGAEISTDLAGVTRQETEDIGVEAPFMKGGLVSADEEMPADNSPLISEGDAELVQVSFNMLAGISELDYIVKNNEGTQVSVNTISCDEVIMTESGNTVTITSIIPAEHYDAESIKVDKGDTRIERSEDEGVWSLGAIDESTDVYISAGLIRHNMVFTVSGDVTAVRYLEYESEMEYYYDNPLRDEITAVVSDNTATVSVNETEFIAISEVETVSEASAQFVRVTKDGTTNSGPYTTAIYQNDDPEYDDPEYDDPEGGGLENEVSGNNGSENRTVLYRTQTYPLGTVDTDDFYIDVAVAKLKSTSVSVNLPEDRDYELEVSVDDEILAGEYLDAYRLYNAFFDKAVSLDLRSGDDITNYRIESPIRYRIGTGGPVGNLNADSYGMGEYRLDIPFDIWDAAAFAEGEGEQTITIDASVVKAGKQKRRICFDGVSDNSVVVYGYSNGEQFELYDDESKAVDYGKKAVINVAASSGFKLEKVYCMKYADYEAEWNRIVSENPDPDDDTVWKQAFSDWAKAEAEKGGKDNPVKSLAIADGKAAVTFNKTEDNYMIWYVTEPVYVLCFDGQEAEDGMTADVIHNSLCPIRIIKGYDDVILGGNGSKVTAAVHAEGDREVTSDVFSYIDPEATEIVFCGEKVQGRTVSVNIVQNGETPEYDFTLNINVGKAVSENDVKFAEDSYTVQLGAVKSIELTTGEGFDKDSYIPIVSGNSLSADGISDNSICVEKSEDGKSIYVTTDVSSAAALTAEGADFEIVLIDAYDYTVVADEAKLVIGVSDVKGAGLDDIEVTPAPDSIKLDFSKLSGFDKATKGLYYVVEAERIDEPVNETDQLVDSVKCIVPSDAESYTLMLVRDIEDSYEPNSIRYKVKVTLVQVTGLTDEDEIDEEQVVTKSDTSFEKDVSTVVNGTFPTKIKFKKDKNLPKKIFNTMDHEIVLGTVTYPAISKGKYPSVNRLAGVELRDEKGRLIALAGDDSGIIAQNDNVISINPYRLNEFEYDEEFGVTLMAYVSGRFNVVAYATEPRGKEVTCSFRVDVLQGIPDITVMAPGKIYKAPGKKAVLKPSLRLGDPEPAVKKVTWSLMLDPNEGIPLKNPGIKLNKKNGTVTFAKKLVIPEEGIKFALCARAADYKGHDETDLVWVNLSDEKEAPAFIKAGEQELRNGGSYYTSQLYNDNGYGELAAGYENGEVYDDVTFEAKGIKKYAFNDGHEYLYPVKLAKNVKITAKATDGSGMSRKFKFNVISDKNLKFRLEDDDQNDILVYDETAGYTAVNDFGAEKCLVLYVSGENKGLIDHSVRFSGLSKVKKLCRNAPDGSKYVLKPTKRNATITITDKTKGNAKTVIKVTNNKVSVGRKPVTVTASNRYDASYKSKKGRYIEKDNKGKIFNLLYFDQDEYAAAGSYNRVTYTVKNASGSVRISTGDHMLNEIFVNTAGFVKGEACGEYNVELTNGKFVVDYYGYDYNDEGRGFYIPEGTYSFTVTPIDENGLATAKGKTVKVRAKAAPKAKVSMKTTKFKKFVSQADIGFKTMKNIVFNDQLDEEGNVLATETSAAYTGELLGVNVKGRINNFKKIFATTGDTGGEDNKLTCIEDPGNEAKGTSGWIRYSWTNLDGSAGYAWTKVTVKPPKKGVITKYVAPEEPDPDPDP